MRKAEVTIGATYGAKVSGKLAHVRLDRVSQYGGWEATNLGTGRTIRIRTAARLRPLASPRALYLLRACCPEGWRMMRTYKAELARDFSAWLQAGGVSVTVEHRS